MNAYILLHYQPSTIKPSMKYLFFSILCLISPLVYSQTPFCGSDLLPADPASKALRIQLEKQAYDFFVKQQSQGHPEGPSQVLTISVVVHIIHNNGTENISDAQVQQGLAWLNSAYANTSFFDQGSGTNVGIQFCLAQLDPVGQPTSGITRNQSPLTDVIEETQDGPLKSLNIWDTKSYLNIWLVREICSTVAGCGVVAYAYGPQFHGTAIDGLVVESQFFGTVQSQTSVAAHELGHYFGLYHTFEEGCNNNDCLADGDRVCDTPPDNSTAATACGTIVNSCSTDTQSGFSSDQPDMTSNFMDYGDISCFHDFTQGQANRMNFYLTTTRHSLLESNGCLTPCTAPVVSDFTASATIVSAGQTVNFTNTSENATIFQWAVNGTPFSSATNAIYTFTIPGTYTVTLLAQGDNPGVCGPATNQVTIQVVCAVAPPVHATVCAGEPFFYHGTLIPLDSIVFVYLPGDPCDSLVRVQVETLPPVIVTLPADTLLPVGIVFTIPAMASGTDLSFNWEPATGLNCTTCLQPFLTAQDTITYTLSAMDSNGCLASDSITLLVNSDCGLKIPNAFTPNGDGLNDRFYPLADICVRTVRVFRVVNRWGQVVFEAYNIPGDEKDWGWDGRWKNKDLSSDVLVWMAEFEYYDGRVEQKKGEVMLLR